MAKERNESGQYVETIDLDTVRGTVKDGGHIVTRGDVADELNCSREAARQKLMELHEDGQIEREDSGVVWWMESPWPTEPPEDETSHQRRRRRKQAGKEVVPTIVEHLRENGSAREQELKVVAWQSGGDIYIEDKDTLWEAAKSRLATHNDVKPGGMGPWKYTGEP